VCQPPQTAEDKFKTGLQDSFDYSSFIFVGAQAGLSQATNSYPAFHQGARGYARYYLEFHVPKTFRKPLKCAPALYCGKIIKFCSPTKRLA
jgi:hypothetical protein